MQEVFLPDENSTLLMGVKISRYLRPGNIVGFSGPLGAGKTTLTRGIVRGLGGDPSQVHSPTFSLSHLYECPNVFVNHCDFYRLAEGSELADLGGIEFFSEPQIYLVEWLERCGIVPTLQRQGLSFVHLQHDKMGRKIRFPEAWKILD